MHSIVLIEDEPPTLFMVKHLIESLGLGFEVVGYAFNGDDGEQIVREQMPDVVITDIKMPGKDGLTVIRNLQAEGIKTEWLILSGYAEFEYAVQALRSGVTDYILKPVDPLTLQTLFEKLGKHLSDMKSKAEQAYLNRLLHEGEVKPPPVTMAGTRLIYPLFVAAGHLTDSIHDGEHIARRFFYPNPFEYSQALRQSGIEKWWNVSGFACNQQILFLLINASEPDFAEKIAEGLMQELHVSDIPVNIMIGESNSNWIDSEKHVHRLLCAMKERLVSGLSQVMREGISENQHEPGFELEATLARLAAMTFPQIRQQLNLLARQGEERGMTQSAVELLMVKLTEVWNNRYTKAALKPWDIQEIMASSIGLSDAFDRFARIAEFTFGEEVEGEKPLSSSVELVRQIEDYLSRHYFTPITYDSLQERFGYHKDYLSQLFRQAKGISPNKYIMTLRIEKAKNIMTNQPDLPLKDLSEQVGYEDALYFSRLFKNMTGLSPSAFREQSITREKQAGGLA
ncbi:response regulator transcription factor [Cohnella silvisoli]|uniref:Response regulator n=1 Tax=Cohnella silvisoli TaxID=2873699 RepID=A0ABV1KZZ3_9BACL|nr:response regulator [Cohnella silvisoli]MCD9024905.1 response regulator [Cohnella silvisoli]